MDDIFLTPEEVAFQKQVRTNVGSLVAPNAAAIDRSDSVPQEIFDALGPYRSICYPTDYGGQGSGITHSCIVMEELGAACPALVTYIEIAELFGQALLIAGRPEQKAEYLHRLGAGAVGAYALTDTTPGSDPGAMQSRAVRAGGMYRLTGGKRHITFFDLADFFVLFAKTESGVTAFLLDRPESGIEIVRRSEWSGLRGHTAWDFNFDLEVPIEARLGEEGTGLGIALKVLNHTRITLAAGHCGLARSALALAQKFASEHIVGGQKLWQHQAVGFAIVEAQTRLEAARLLTYKAARLSELGLPHRQETSQAKFFAAETMLDAVGVCNRVLGGLGGHLDTPAERYLRDAYTWIAAHGTIEVQKLTAAREFFRPV